MLRTGLLVVALLVAVVSSRESTASPRNNLGYDPQADPFVQYHRAIEEARTEGKLVLLIAGGDWCSWCHALERFIERNAEVSKGLDEAFVTVKVYVGDENYNEFFFSQLPEARGAPHFWIVSPDRHVLSSQSTAPFERRRSYDKREFLDFIERWKSGPTQSARSTPDFMNRRS